MGVSAFLYAGSTQRIRNQDMREHTGERLEKEWNELYTRIKTVLLPYGADDMDGGDYYVVDENFENYVHQVEIHKLHMLRPEIIKTLQSVLVGYPDWEIEVSLFIPEADISIDPSEGITVREDAVVDRLDRKLLPDEYRNLCL
jgi:hypothetical protein